MIYNGRCGNCGDLNLYKMQDWVEEEQSQDEVYSDICDRSEVEDKVLKTEQEHYRLGYRIALKRCNETF